MSRIGKKLIVVPDGVEIEIKEGWISVTGPKGKQNMVLHPQVRVKRNEGALEVMPIRDDRVGKSLQGTTRSLVSNLVEGVTRGFEKRLEIAGVGYRVDLEGTALKLQVGYSNPKMFPAPEGIEFVVENPVFQQQGSRPAQFLVKGIDKQKVGEVASKIRSVRPPEPYKGKGIRYEGEYIRRKAGKTAGA
ncbi:MAG: 50S ribosomal protein L6 [Candidatus Latescibacterota bacterium]